MFCNDVLLRKKLLKKGNFGVDVTQLQKALRLLGYSFLIPTVTGIYDSGTYEAVRQYQDSQGLHVDGVVGPKTGGSLCSQPILKGIFQQPSQWTYPPPQENKTTAGNIPFPGEGLGIKTSTGLSLKSIPSWVWIGVIGISLIMMVGGGNGK